MAPKTIWSLPTIQYESLSAWKEERPVALLADPAGWNRAGAILNLPIVVQAEPERMDQDFINYLVENIPSVVEVIYVLGNSHLAAIGKLVAHASKRPLVIIPTELDSDQILEAHVELLHDGLMSNVYTGSAEQIVVDWDLISSADQHQRAGMIADMLAVVTGLLDWRHAAKLKRTTPDQPFVPWAAGTAAGLASQAIKIADAVGRGEVEALRNLLDLVSVSVQLANQLGHARQQEGTEHYFAYALEKQGVKNSHAECLGPGILLTSALHNQDPSALRDALHNAGIRLNQLRPADVQLAINDLPTFVMANDLPYAIAHELDPFSDAVQKALRIAGLSEDTGGWVVGGDTGMMGAAPTQPQTPASAMPTQAQTPISAQPTQPQTPTAPNAGAATPPAQTNPPTSPAGGTAPVPPVQS